MTSADALRFSGRTALVTGAGAGIGRAITLRLVKEGANVLALDVSDTVESVAREAGSAVRAVRCDVSDPHDVEAAFSLCRNHFARLDLLFNNAGISGPLKRIHEYALADWDRVMAVNLRGAFVVLQQALKMMLESGGGAVVNTASIGAFHATPLVSAYVSSKGGLAMLTRAAALEYVGHSIRVNAVCPGTVETPMTKAASAEIRARQIARAPIGRLAEPEEVAGLALFLASDDASYITGQCYLIDGGRSAA